MWSIGLVYLINRRLLFYSLGLCVSTLSFKQHSNRNCVLFDNGFKRILKSADNLGAFHIVTISNYSFESSHHWGEKVRPCPPLAELSADRFLDKYVKSALGQISSTKRARFSTPCRLFIATSRRHICPKQEPPSVLLFKTDNRIEKLR